jgi:NAD(P)-dependent dehydrogenase (short-subunit alcohol dehydrogenase family)
MSSLEGSVILITGAAGDVGQACADLFLQRGARVVLSDRTPSPERFLARPEVVFQAADVTDAAAVDATVRLAVERFGRLDAAVLAAGIEGPVAPIEEIDGDAFDQVMAVNVKGCLHAMQACLRAMKPQGAGSIVALSSISGVVGGPNLGTYTASKHAMIGLVRSAALEAGPHGVRVNAVCPGPIASNMMRRLDEALSARDPARAAGRPDASKSLPLQKYVTVEEVAQMAAFLCGDESGSCHGGTYLVDGGYTAR